MQKKLHACVSVLSMAMTGPLMAATDVEKAELERLRIENRRLSEDLQNAKTELQELKGQPAPTESTQPGTGATREIRELNMPLPQTAEEQQAAPTSTVPSSSAKKDWVIAVGTKLWLTEWSTWRTPVTSDPLASRGQNISILTSKDNAEVSPIPSLTIRYKKFFFSGSYLSETDYDFPDQSQLFSVFDPDSQQFIPAQLNYSLSGSRREWDVTLGYQVLPYAAVTVGYKDIKQTFKQQSCSGTITQSLGNSLTASCDIIGAGNVLDFSADYAGPTIGVSGAAPIGHGFGIYGNFTYGWLGANYRDSSFGDSVGDVDYYVSEFGFTYSHLLKELPVYLPLSSATAYAGYRYQTYTSEVRGIDVGGNKPKDVVQGFVAGLNFAF